MQKIQELINYLVSCHDGVQKRRCILRPVNVLCMLWMLWSGSRAVLGVIKKGRLGS